MKKNLENKLNELLSVREEFMKCGHNDEKLNDKIRELQSKILQLKTT